MIDLSGFNDRQKEAILQNEGPLLILAGAGSGKTRVLTTKVAKLIDDGVDVSEILAITFTNKASKEMKERITKLVGRDAYYIQISTFHSFGLKILKENYNLLEYNRNFTIIDSEDGKNIKIGQIRLLQEQISEKPIVSDKKVYIINNSDLMTVEAQNCLLKTLEEPPEYALIILILSNENKLLNTIKSRCTKISFNKLTSEDLQTYSRTNNLEINDTLLNICDR